MPLIITIYLLYISKNNKPHLIMAQDINATAIAASVSILVAVIAAVTTLWLNRSAKQTEIKTVNTVILTEISRLLQVVCSSLSWWHDCMKDNNTDLPLIPYNTDVYDNFLKNIGDLDGAYAGSAVGFYGYVKFLNALQQSRDEHIKIHKEKEFIKTYEVSLYRLVKNYRNKFDEEFTRFKIERPEMHLCKTDTDDQGERLKSLGIKI
jgi:hypothetical protein